MMAVCPVRRFTPKLIRVYETHMLKKLAWSTFDEIQLKDGLRETASDPHKNPP
jgi:hypothetical protein